MLYDVTIEDGRIARCQPRSASFHNLVLMHEVFAGDILTDFPFIEASFGLSVAGAALMSIWVLRGLRDGVVTTRWPGGPTSTRTPGAARSVAAGRRRPELSADSRGSARPGRSRSR